jgi:2-oxoglutarate dehydrogenase complex, dehydrogenase (E1) component, and related enzymes
LLDPQHEGANITKVLLCSDKVYYDLAAYREENGLNDTAILRFERLYQIPFRLPEVMERYPNAEIRWVQEEPANQGAWSFIAMNAPGMINRPIEGVARPPSSSPAVGTHQRHVIEQQAIVERAFA